MVDHDSIYGENLKCLSIVGSYDELLNKWLGNVIYLLINKLMSKDLMYRLPNQLFVECKVCYAYVKEK